MAELSASLATQMPALPITSGVMKKATGKNPAQITAGEMFPAMQERRGEELRLRQGIADTESQLAGKEQEQKVAGLEQKQSLQQVQATELRNLPERADLNLARDELNNAAFVPTKESAQDIATIFSLTGIIGMAIGGGAKDNAYAAMAGMNGMLEGYKRGRADIYKRERESFDKNLKALQLKVQTLQQELTEAIQLKQQDFKAGETAIEIALAKSGSDLLDLKRKKNGDMAMLETVVDSGKDVDSLVKMSNDQFDKAEKLKLDRERLNIDRARLGLEGQRVEIERQKAMSADEKRKAAVDKMPKEDRAAYQLRETLIPQLEKALPVLDRINKQGRWTEMTAALGLDPRVAEMQFRNDAEALDLIRTFALFRSKEFETAGKALTKVENKILAPLYQSEFRVYEGIRNAMNSGLEEMKRQKGFIENQYPSLKARQEGAVSASEQPAASGATQRPSFASEAEADAAFASGAIQDKTPISVGGRNAIYRAR
jgi:hypothetical protein